MIRRVRTITTTTTTTTTTTITTKPPQTTRIIHMDNMCQETNKTHERIVIEYLSLTYYYIFLVIICCCTCMRSLRSFSYLTSLLPSPPTTTSRTHANMNFDFSRAFFYTVRTRVCSCVAPPSNTRWCCGAGALAVCGDNANRHTHAVALLRCDARARQYCTFYSTH